MKADDLNHKAPTCDHFSGQNQFFSAFADFFYRL